MGRQAGKQMQRHEGEGVKAREPNQNVEARGICSEARGLGMEEAPQGNNHREMTQSGPPI